uniref:transmembrane protein 176A-like n=1 Tax=Semicossyphus pulcher TaxID=241346 RepID=UPI0037E7D36F
MSVTKTKVDGATVLTLTSDPKSSCPPLCQIVKALCYSPACCTMSQNLKRIQGTSQSVLGALQIMVGLLNIGLGGILTGNAPWWNTYDYLFSFWLGGMFILFGAMCIVSEKRPIPCLVILNVVLNLTGIAFAVAAIVLYSINMATTSQWWMCSDDDYYDYSSHDDKTPSPEEKMMMEKCLESKGLVQMLMTSIYAVLIVLSVLELCIVISSAVLGIKSLRRSAKSENESPEDPESYKKLLDEVTSNPPA